MAQRALCLLTIVFALYGQAFSQFSVNIGLHRHNDAFFMNFDAYGKPFVAYTMVSAGVGYTRKKLRWHADVSTLDCSRHLEESFSSTSYSQGGAGTTYVDEREADVRLSYVGVRAGMDVELKRTEHFSFAMGLSQHVDVLTLKEMTNVYRTTYTDFPEYDYYLWIDGQMVLVHSGGNTPPVKEEGTFPVVDVAEQYWYTNVAFKPAFHFGRATLELQFLLNFFIEPRVINRMINRYYNDEQPFYATAFVRGYNQSGRGLYVSNEIGIALKYTLGKAPAE